MDINSGNINEKKGEKCRTHELRQLPERTPENIKLAKNLTAAKNEPAGETLAKIFQRHGLAD
jgi:hypothetical protein